MRGPRVISYSRPACIPEHCPLLHTTTEMRRLRCHCERLRHTLPQTVCFISLYITSYSMDPALYPGTALKPMAIGYLPPKMSDPTLFLRLLDVRLGVY